jgi:hypothetical protein
LLTSQIVGSAVARPLPQFKNNRKLTLFQRGADANKSSGLLARKVCEIFHVFAGANVFDNF